MKMTCVEKSLNLGTSMICSTAKNKKHNLLSRKKKKKMSTVVKIPLFNLEYLPTYSSEFKTIASYLR